MQALLSCNRPLKATPLHSASSLYLQFLDLTFCVTSSQAGLLDDVSQLMREFRRTPFTHVTYLIEIREAHSTSSQTGQNHKNIRTVQIRINGRIRYRYVPIAELAPFLEWIINSLVVRASWGQERYCLLHAAVVVKGRKGVLICGKSGAGKSSLSLALMYRHGYQYLTDEIACWDTETEKFVAYPKAIMLKERGFLRFQETYPQLHTQMWDSKRFSQKVCFFNPSTKAPSRVRKTAKINMVVFPRYRERESLRVSSLPKAQALLCLQKERFDSIGFSQGDFDKLTGLLNGTSVSRVLYHNVFEAADMIDALAKKRSV
jgi:hypothetical protein